MTNETQTKFDALAVRENLLAEQLQDAQSEAGSELDFDDYLAEVSGTAGHPLQVEALELIALRSRDTEEPTGADALAEHYGYWQDHPTFSAEDWRYEVANGDTRQSYWDWVAAQVALAGD